MPLYIRKSIAIGPLRINFSKSGIGLSVGVRGFRIGTGPRGHYVHMGMGGVYYRQTLGRRQRRLARSATPQGPSQQEMVWPLPRESPAMTTVQPKSREYETTAASALKDSDAQQLLVQINRRRRRLAWFPLMCVIGIVAVALAVGLGMSLFTGGFTAVAAFLLGAVAWHYDRMRRITFIHYDLEEPKAKAFGQVVEVFKQLQLTARIWNASQVMEAKQGSWTIKTLVQFRRVHLALGQPPYIRTNMDVPILPAGRQVLVLLPDRMLVSDRWQTGAVSYEALRVVCADAFYALKNNHLPADAELVPDASPLTAPKGSVVCVFGELQFSSESGLNELFVFSHRKLSRQFALALKQYVEPETLMGQVPTVG
ncbi:MAG: DUF4236 domain-containing protein [Chitinophagales bacterium]|nr:DUF4236 domain-containing protein [Chitinophagales bacterium]MDW8427201.1 DUF4236 domain-containing protein [Chitinophagales bacterium]